LQELTIKIKQVDHLMNITGVKHNNIRLLENHFGVTIIADNEKIVISSENKEVKQKIEEVLTILLEIAFKGISITERDIIYLLQLQKADKIALFQQIYDKNKILFLAPFGKKIYYKTLTQKYYLEALEKNDLVFAVGAAGTGKTYLAVLYAVKLLKEAKVKKIILTRPAVEAGESLGYLPGDLKEKIDPYLRPLYDALYEFLGTETVDSYLTRGIIEIAPLAYMRGRTLENAAIILDEAQNTTNKQMLMFLSRLGFSSKMIVTGDITQIDLPKGEESGLLKAIRILKNIKGIETIEFQKMDVVRHPLVQKILERYEN